MFHAISIDPLLNRVVKQVTSVEPVESDAYLAQQRRSKALSSSEETTEDLERKRRKVPLPVWKRKIFTVPVKDTWPAPVFCKMNIAEWTELMKVTGLEKDILYITEGFKNGFCLGIPQHEIKGLPWYTPENHKSAVMAREQIELTLQKEKLAGRLVGPFSHEEVQKQFGFFRSNPMGGAVNGDG